MGSCEGVRCGGDKRCVLDAELGAHCVRCGACTVAGAPLCAADGRTYAGACALRRAACERGHALPLAYRGSCKGIGFYICSFKLFIAYLVVGCGIPTHKTWNN